MTNPTDYENAAAICMAEQAKGIAQDYAKPEDLDTAAMAILAKAILVISPDLKQERLVGLILGENE